MDQIPNKGMLDVVKYCPISFHLSRKHGRSHPQGDDACHDCRAVRCCTWAGQWTFKPWPKVYMMPIEDPFDATDNCARSIFAANAEYVSKTLQESLMATQRLNSASGEQAILPTHEHRRRCVMCSPECARCPCNYL